MNFETSFDYESSFNSIAIHCPVCGKMAFITMTPVHKTGKSTVEAECGHFRFTINDEHYALDIDLLGQK